MRAWVYKVNARYPRRRSEAKTLSLSKGFTGLPTVARRAQAGWHFDQYFRYRGRGPYDMGGRDWIRSPLSWARLRRVRAGDLFVCYQADERRIYGLARAATSGYESLPRRSPKGVGVGLPGSGIFDSVDFEPPKLRGGLRLANPVNVQHPRSVAKTPSLSRGAAREVFRHIRAFTVPSRGTIHALAADELRAVLRVLIAANPTQRRAILSFAKRRLSNF